VGWSSLPACRLDDKDRFGLIKSKYMKEIKHDIVQRDDIKTLVDCFYEKVKADPLLGPVFSHVDWPHHLPIMYNFWSSMLLGDQSYRGNPLQRHLHLSIDRIHFDQWLAIFKQTVDELFEGEKADEVKMRAHAIAGMFQVKMGLMSNN
jgi:hemoglobin